MLSTEKNLVNDLYHTAVVGGLAMGNAKINQMVFKGPLPKLDFTPHDVGIVILDLSTVTASMAFLIK